MVATPDGQGPATGNGVAAFVVHRLPRRLRLSIPDRRHDAAYFARLTTRLAAQPAVDAVKANPMTGSVTIGHTVPWPALRQMLEHEALCLVENADAVPRQTPRQPAAWAGPAPLLVSGREIDIRFMAGVVFAVAGVVQTVRGRILLPALSAFWYASRAFQEADKPR